ncbi:hypothetical protein [Haloferax profundi]|uniref:DUF8106 domain-containing protein n=1 Tax=Haloferax profundi TaxID=1544718 RepID=A0A0W1SQ15_9EURY|nr:hypothetical protein [Haloferax profundi]KTG28351.1 hypothetical protein AUR66_12145 [Haloferax profundi]
MNPSPRAFSTDPPDTARRKTVLFCQTCGRAGDIGDWPTEMTDERVETIDCPDCGTTVWQGFDADDDAESKRALTPTA